MLREWFFVAKDQLDWKKLLSVHRSGEAARSVPSSLPVASNQFSKLVVLIDPTSTVTYPYIYSTHFGGLLVESNYITSCSTNSSKHGSCWTTCLWPPKTIISVFIATKELKGQSDESWPWDLNSPPSLEVLSPKGTQGNSRLQHNLQP